MDQKSYCDLSTNVFCPRNNVLMMNRRCNLPLSLLHSPPSPSRSIRLHQCSASLWHASCWERPPLSCSPFSRHWTALWRPFTTRAAQGGGRCRRPKTCLSRRRPNAPADAPRRACVSPLRTPTLACSQQVGCSTPGARFKRRGLRRPGHAKENGIDTVPVRVFRRQRGARQPLGLSDQPAGAAHRQNGVWGLYESCYYILVPVLASHLVDRLNTNCIPQSLSQHLE